MHRNVIEKLRVLLTVSLVVGTGLTASARAGERRDIVDTAAGVRTFSTLVAAVKAAGLVDTLKGDGPFTVFAPTNDAFAKLPLGTVESLMKPENKDKLVALLTYHVVPGRVLYKDAVKLTSAETLEGRKLKFAVDDGVIMVNDSQVFLRDVMASNGVIHAIDSVLLPPADNSSPNPRRMSKPAGSKVAAEAKKDIVDTAAGVKTFSTLVAAVKAAGLVDTLKGDGPFTVFAPTDEAFSKLPAGTVENLLKPENKSLLTAILAYHVVPDNMKATDVVKLDGVKTLNGQMIDISITDGRVMVDNAKVIKTDIAASNGTIHVIDSVILPSTKDIIDTAVEAGSFKTLAAAIQAAGLIETLKGEGPFTVFAPTDEAFAKLPEGTVESLLKPKNKSKLAEVLTYHVVPGRIYAADAIAAGKANTVQGQSVRVEATDSGVTVDGAKVIKANIDTSNGVIHVIDSVILPKNSAEARREARHMVINAIHKGSHLYNTGHADQCAKTYMTTASRLVKMSPAPFCEGTRQNLVRAMNASSHTQCMDTRAWTMRRALDHALASLN